MMREEQQRDDEPLQIQVLQSSVDTTSDNTSTTNHHDNNDNWKVHQRLVTKAKDDGTIETVWQENVISGVHRIAIYEYTAPSGRGNNQHGDGTTLHVSLQLLPEQFGAVVAPQQQQGNCNNNNNALAWWSISSSSSCDEHQKANKNHKILACLVNPTAVVLWDVYPCQDDDNNANQSSLLQLPAEGWTVTLPFDCCSIHAAAADDTTSCCSLLLQRLPDAEDMADWQHQHHATNSNNTTSASSISSLFTLHHPLQDVLPVVMTDASSTNAAAATMSQAQPRLFTDVFEQILWVGGGRATDDDDNDTTLMVTYHTTKQRHGIWKVVDAPLPPKEIALHNSIRFKYTADDCDHTFEDLLEYENTNTTAGSGGLRLRSMSRDEALADALGVRRGGTPMRTASTTTATTTTATTVAASRKRPAETALFSPNVSSSHTTTTAAAAAVAAIPNHHTPLLHAKVAVQCVYTEKDHCCPAPAKHVFCCATGSKTNNSSTLCLQTNTQLKLYSCYGNFELRNVISCLASQPITIVGRPQPKTNILVLRSIGQLSLYHAAACCTTPIVNCSLRGEELATTAITTDLSNAVQDRVCLTIGDNDDVVIGKLSLSVTSNNDSAEKVLQVLDAVFNDDEIAALKIRADCCRLLQQRQQRQDSNNGDEFMAVRAVVSAITKYELFGNFAAGVDMQTTTGEEIMELDCSAWQRLLESDYHQTYASENQSILLDEAFDNNNDKSSSSNGKAVDEMEKTLSSIGSLAVDYLHQNGTKNILQRIFDSLHLLYEDSKLTVHANRHQLAELLVEMCQTIKAARPEQNGVAVDMFLEYYRRDVGYRIVEAATRKESPAPPPSTFFHSVKFTSFTSPPSILSWIDKTMRGDGGSGVLERSIYDTGVASINAACTKTRSIIRIFSILFDSAYNPTRDIDVVLALLEEGFTEATNIAQDLPPGVSLPILEVLHRCRNSPGLAEFLGWSADAWELVGRRDLSLNMSKTEAPVKKSADKLRSDGTVDDDEDKDGLVPLERSSAMLFPEDNRVHEAARLLRSSRPMFLRVARAVEVSDHDYEKLKQKRLLMLSHRTLALPIGRGMLTIGSLRPVPAEPLPLPELCLKGRVPPTNATLRLDTSDCPSDMSVWPEFHNGVASGLRLPADRDHAKITRTWIVYNRPPASRPAEQQDSTNDERPAHTKQTHSHGGLLLALGLRGHLTALDMSDIYEYLTQGTVTTTVGVLLGLAANKRGSCDISVSKMLCLHIPSLIPQHFNAIDVASTVQTAAVIGAGLLFQGSSHRMMTEFLLNEIGKRPDNDVSTFEREAYTTACGLALGIVNLGLGKQTSTADSKAAGLADLRIEERLLRYIIGGRDREESRRTRESNDRFSLPTSTQGSDNEKCSTIYEGDLVNTDVTAPGAILALGLMFMKTENRTIASALAPPDTHFLLEFVRPDFLGLRVISRAMILWKEVQPTKEWIELQVPLVVRTAYKDMRTAAKAAHGLRSPAGKGRSEVDYDRRAVRQMYAHVVAGACFGIGLRFAGTGNKKAKAALYERVTELHALREANDPVSVASRPEMPILENCLGCAAIALAMVLAGTGDLEALKLFKILRWRCDKDSKYGSHMTYGMAIGLLFLGGGTCTIGREPEDIAALVTAFFPRFPMTTSDNQYHLQALRHLYALAVKQRELRAIDVDTWESVYVPIQIRADEMSKPQLFQAPCLLRNSDNFLKELEVISDKYYPLKLDLAQCDSSYVFYVKKRNAQIAHPQDAVVHRLSLGLSGVLRQNTAQLVKSITDSPFFTAFAEHMCKTQSKNDFTSRVLLECLTEDSEEAIALYLILRHGVSCLLDGGATALNFLWNLKLIRSYYHRARKRIVDSSSKPLLNGQLLLPYLQDLTDRVFSSGIVEDNEALRNALSFYD